MLTNHPLVIDAMIEDRHQRLRNDWQQGSQPGWLRRAVGHQMIRIGEWIEGDRQAVREQLEAHASRRVVLS